ncbi:MAG: DUF2938 family protein [Proteobacteria bacterium]|nr:DUF2938 family protein [Pseudomonadota bacterium]
MSSIEILVKAAAVGIGGTLVLDLYALFLARVMGVPATNWAMVGRWFGNMPRGQFIQAAMSKAEPVKSEPAIGWIAHYAIGAGYGLLLLALWGRAWLNYPTVLPPMLLSWVLLIAPYFVMMPGMGLGIAGRRTPRPNITRLKSVAGHSVFGLGMYATAVALSRFWPTPL